jgi:hypothetical protein
MSDEEKKRLLPEPVLEDDDDQPKPIPKRDLALMLFLNFLSTMGFSVVLPSLWPFIASVSSVLRFHYQHFDLQS